MSKRIFFLFLQIILFLMVLGCSNSGNPNTIEVQPSNAVLTIGVVGAFPEVNEKHVTFKHYTLERLNENIDPTFDALFIMPNHLKEAAELQYAELYKKLPYPTFFIGSEKPYYAFINEDMTYESAPSAGTLSYTHGFVMLNNQYKIWEFGLYNDVVNEKNIKEMYTRVFETINNFKNYPIEKNN